MDDKERVRLYGIDILESRIRDLEEKKYGKAGHFKATKKEFFIKNIKDGVGGMVTFGEFWVEQHSEEGNVFIKRY